MTGPTAGEREPSHQVVLGLLGGALATEPFELADGAGRDHLEHALADPPHVVGDREQFLVGGEGAGHRLAPQRSVTDRARRAEADGTGIERLGDDAAHRVEVVGGRVFVQPAALAHRVEANRAVGDLGADVERVLATRRCSRGSRRTSPTAPSPCPRGARRPGCPRRLPSARSVSARDPGATGAKPTPQLPITTVVTPLCDDGAICESQLIWPS